jgi:uncharacterized protein (DUF885 family)
MGPKLSRVSPPDQLQMLADAWWNLKLGIDPTLATELGVAGHDHELPDISGDGLAQHRSKASSLLEEAAALSRADLDANASLALAVLMHDIEDFVARSNCRQEYWLIDHLRGPQRWFLGLGQIVNLRTADDRKAYHERLRRFDKYITDHTQNLRAGLADGLTAPRRHVEIVIAQLDSIDGSPVDEDPLLIPSADPETRSLVERVVRPAYRRYRAFLQDQVLPHAREEVGIWSLPINEGCYAELIHRETTLPLSPAEVSRIGQDETEGIRQEMEALASSAFPGQDLRSVIRRLRSDSGYAFLNREEVIASARTAIERASAALPNAFPLLPEAPIRVEAVPSHEEFRSPPGYFRTAAVDGSRPATYYVNTRDPRSRPRYTSEALAFHECLPGHHLQTSFAQSREGMPAFQRHLLLNAYVEGWAVYAERLADELGLYSDGAARMGMLAYQAWRSARLVAETGIHAFGWGITRAVDYMVSNTALTRVEAENEVDRYIVWPGQGLAYGIGRTWIMRLRERAYKVFGRNLSLRAFHETVLKNGAIPLELLEREVNTWITTGAEQARRANIR